MQEVIITTGRAASIAPDLMGTLIFLGLMILVIACIAGYPSLKSYIKGIVFTRKKVVGIIR